MVQIMHVAGAFRAQQLPYAQVFALRELLQKKDGFAWRRVAHTNYRCTKLDFATFQPRIARSQFGNAASPFMVSREHGFCIPGGMDVVPRRGAPREC
jgi:hypothetical protein